jgi:hypothetical protein
LQIKKNCNILNKNLKYSYQIGLDIKDAKSENAIKKGYPFGQPPFTKK